MSLPSSEQWRPVPGYEGRYEASNHGRIRSLPRQDRLRRAIAGRILKPGLDSGGYLTYNLWTDGKGRTQRGHNLVMLAFVGPPPVGLEVRHLDGDPANNVLANLAYGTPSENQLDNVRHGTHFWAGKAHCPQGHPYEAGNLIAQRGRTNRLCRTCYRDRAERRRRSAGVLPRAAKTHCPHGHPYSAENTYTSPDGRRMCRICRRAASYRHEMRRAQGVLS